MDEPKLAVSLVLYAGDFPSLVALIKRIDRGSIIPFPPFIFNYIYFKTAYVMANAVTGIMV